MHARPRARRGRSPAGSRRRTARRLAAPRPARPRPRRERSPASTTPASPAGAERGERGVERRASAPPASTGPRRRVGTSTCAATSCSRVRRGCTTVTRAPCAAAFRSRRWRIGTSFSASRPTTRITYARSTSRYRDGHRARRRREGAGPVDRGLRPRGGGRGRSCRARSARASTARRRPRPIEPPTGEEPRRGRRGTRGDPQQRLAERRGSSPCSRRSGIVIRSGASRGRNANRPLSHDPGVVHIEVVAREHAHDLAPAQVDPDVAPGAAVRCRRCPRSSGRTAGRRTGTGSRSARRPDRSADVAREGRSEVLARRDRDALPGAAREQLDEPVARDLVAEPRAPRAQHAALSVEVDERRERQRASGRRASPRGTGSRRGRRPAPGPAGGTRRPGRRSGSRAGG